MFKSLIQGIEIDKNNNHNSSFLLYSKIYHHYKFKYICTGEPDENNINFWMFTYDFKMRKRDSIFDRVSKDIIEKRKLKNKLILLLYVTVGIIFFHTNLLLTQILLLILEKN